MSDQDFADSMERGLAAHREGRMADALAAYRAALSLKPEDAEAMSLMGLALVHGGRSNEGLIFMNRAVDIEPRAVGLRMNLAEGLVAAGQQRRAMQEFRTVTDLEPGHVRAWERVGDVAASLGDEAAAVDGWGRSYLVDHQNIDAALKVARLEMGRGRADVAMRLLDTLLSRAPGEPRALMLKAQSFESRREWQRLAELAAGWARVRPDDADAWRFVSKAAYESARHIDAVNAFKRALQLIQPTAADWSALASLCMHALDFDSATAALEKAEALEPGSSATLGRRALLLMYEGKFAKAEEYCRRALAADPSNVSAITTLSRLRSGRMSDAELKMVEAVARRADVDVDSRIAALFAVAHAQDARKDIDAAFRTYEQAHELALGRDAAEGKMYDRAGAERRAQRIIELSRAPSAFTPDAGTVRPIFIVGMPRSGTTLIESVLGVHSRVFAMGERPEMRQILSARLDMDARAVTPDAQVLRSWGQAYLSGVPAADSKGHMTDKHPLNFEAVGLIAELFPDAQIVHVRRNPLETGLSIFRQEFNKLWTFTHRLADIGHFYGLYAHLADHWQRHLADRFLTVQYEDFVADFAAQAQQLVERCGLTWEPECLDFQEVSRAIATFSTVQARAPVSSGNGRAQLYARYLGPMVDELERSRVDLQTGALRTG